jgi:hypothetical protein
VGSDLLRHTRGSSDAVDDWDKDITGKCSFSAQNLHSPPSPLPPPSGAVRELNEKLAITREEKIQEIASITREMDTQKYQLQTDAMSATSKAELELSKERLTNKHMREEIDRMEKELREKQQSCDERVDTVHKAALERVESIQKQLDQQREDALESERKLRDDKLDLQKEISQLTMKSEQHYSSARSLEEKLKVASAKAEEELRAKTAELLRDIAAEKAAVKAAEARRQDAEQRAAAALESEQKVLWCSVLIFFFCFK